MMKIEGSGTASGSGSISQRHGSADPDPHQNVIDPQHCKKEYNPKSLKASLNFPANRCILWPKYMYIKYCTVGVIKIAPLADIFR